MKTKVVSLLIVWTALLSGSIVKAQSATKDEAVIKVFKAFQQKDVNAYVKLFPDAATTVRFVQKLLANDSIDEGEKAGMREFLKEITDEKLKEEYSDDFQHQLDKGETRGVIWESATLQSIIADSSFDKETRAHKISGKIYFKSGGKDYFIGYDDVIWFEKEGWFGVTIDRIDEKINENEQEEPEHVFSDTVTIAVDSVRNSDEKKPAPKKEPARAPSNNKNTKQKINTPIKKD